MNYLGHAWVALAHSTEPGFVLGSMLPDFVTMAGARLAPQPDAQVRRGVALHLRTDEVFHDQRGFLELASQVTAQLSARGVGRGAARAVGHIGVELLLDGELVERAELRRAYIDALNAAPGRELVFRDPAQGTLVATLLRRLVSHGPPWDYAVPEGVTRRLYLALHRRPRLRPRMQDAAAIEAVLREAQAELRQCAPQLLEAVVGASHGARSAPG